MTKPRFKPTRWDLMPISARKCFLRLLTSFGKRNAAIRGWEWFVTCAERNRIYAIGPGSRWYVAICEAPGWPLK